MAGAFCLAAGLILALPALSQVIAPVSLAWPVDCQLGDTCFIQHYVDRDPGPGVQDFGCGTLSYDGHDGTDIAIDNRAEMARGVTVRAALGGVVKGVRDSVPDAAPFPVGEDCGNGLIIESDGLQIQYCHLRQGSLQVTKGQTVATGAALGLVGQSGKADFPHLHLTVRKGDVVIDPFSDTAACGQSGSWWWENFRYTPAGLVQAGIADRVPEDAEVKGGTVPAPQAKAGALVIWGEVYGVRPGDIMRLDLKGPKGSILTEDVPFTKAQDRSWQARGKKLIVAPGHYHGAVYLIRNHMMIDKRQIDAEVSR